VFDEHSQRTPLIDIETNSRVPLVEIRLVPRWSRREGAERLSVRQQHADTALVDGTVLASVRGPNLDQPDLVRGLVLKRLVGGDEDLIPFDPPDVAHESEVTAQ